MSEELENPVPPYVSPGQIARACGTNRWQVLRKLRNMKLAERHGTQWCVSDRALREHLPAMYDRVFDYFLRRAESRAEASEVSGSEQTERK